MRVMSKRMRVKNEGQVLQSHISRRVVEIPPTSRWNKTDVETYNARIALTLPEPIAEYLAAVEDRIRVIESTGRQTTIARIARAPTIYN
jgi:hypothetical protein